MLRFQCPHCWQNIKATDSQAGTRASCPHCGKRFLVPELEAEPLPARRARPAHRGLSPCATAALIIFALCAGLCSVSLVMSPFLPKDTSPLGQRQRGLAQQQTAAPAKEYPDPPRDGGTYMAAPSWVYVRMLEDRDGDTYRQGLKGCEVIRDRAAIDGLIAHVAKYRGGGMEEAIACLGRIGPTAHDVLPLLQEIATSERSPASMREAAKQAIRQIDQPEQ